MSYVVLFLCGFVQVFALGFQSRNVNTGQYLYAGLTSLFVGMSQVAVWHRVMAPTSSWIEAAVYGLSGAFGITASMWFHHHKIMKGKR